MPLWKALYGMIWLCFGTLFVSVFDPIPYKGYVHGVIGIAVLALAFRNRAALARTECPARIKRISEATARICVMALVTGVVLAVPRILEWPILYYGVKALHLFTVGAIITQTASVATAHDVWEQRECLPPPPA